MIKFFKDISIRNVPQVGGKNAALGEMYKQGFKVPNGFAITARAFNHFLAENNLEIKIRETLKGLDTSSIKKLKLAGRRIRQLILSAELPPDLEEDIEDAYTRLGVRRAVAVRSSATAEDLPTASFAGQQETYLNVRGINNLLKAVKKCMASLYTDRAISYREDQGFKHSQVALSVGVQLMVPAKVSGITFTIDPDTGFKNVIITNAASGLGDRIVGGKVIPDEYVVFKPTMALIGKDLRQGKRFVLTDKQAISLAKECYKIEEHFGRPMDIEWSQDRYGKFFILQARPETVYSQESNIWPEYKLSGRSKVILNGVAVGTKIAAGAVNKINSPRSIYKFKPGQVLVTKITDPDWEPIMKIAAAIITDKGGRTSHAAIVSRELGIPCIVGTRKATEILKNNELVTVDCSLGTHGLVHQGEIAYQIIKHKLAKIPKLKTKLMLNIGSPEEAWRYHYLPVQGVGLGRLEFIISSHIRIHPNALIDYPKYHKAKINNLTPGYKDKREFYVDELAEGIAKIATTVWPYPAIIRFSDFKTNEYRSLLGGDRYEPEEANPMLGWRGAARYYDERFQEAFELECQAIKQVNMKNIIPMVPFCRTPEEGEKVIKIIRKYIKDSPIYVMAEVPSNIILAEEFLEIFDGMSIGSNDLTQLILGIDRDSGLQIANETHPAVKEMISRVIAAAKKRKKYIGICGQAPSDYPAFARWLCKQGIDSISLNPDSVIRNY